MRLRGLNTSAMRKIEYSSNYSDIHSVYHSNYSNPKFASASLEKDAPVAKMDMLLHCCPIENVWEIWLIKRDLDGQMLRSIPHH